MYVQSSHKVLPLPPSASIPGAMAVCYVHLRLTRSDQQTGICDVSVHGLASALVSLGVASPSQYQTHTFTSHAPKHTHPPAAVHISGRESGGGGGLEPPCRLKISYGVLLVSLKMIHSCQQKVSPSSTACPSKNVSILLLSSSQNISINFSEVHAIDCTDTTNYSGKN